jgi:hypothetical protein
MQDWMIAVGIGLLIGLAIGIKIARDSHKKQPVLGGVPAQIFHYLACSGISSVLPFIITGLIVGLGFLSLFSTAVGLLALTALCLLVDALIERTATKTPTAAH